MFEFFKRREKAAPTSNSVEARPRSAPAKPTRARGADVLEPLPLPQVHEGNQDSDWAMWEDSVLEQDSRFPSQFADTVPSHFDTNAHSAADADVDPFAQIGKNTP